MFTHTITTNEITDFCDVLIRYDFNGHPREDRQSFAKYINGLHYVNGMKRDWLLAKFERFAQRLRLISETAEYYRTKNKLADIGRLFDGLKFFQDKDTRDICKYIIALDGHARRALPALKSEHYAACLDELTELMAFAKAELKTT